MSKYQRRVLLIITLIGLVYFAIFLYPNSYGARSDAILADASLDEHVTYPNVLRILTPGKTLNETRANLFLYEDYHYGYPFYALSALALLPVRLVYGSGITEHMQLNLLILRQMISLLPMVIAAGILVFMQTRFESMFKSVALFLFLLSIRGVVRNHIWWWHPDALAVLAVVLTLFFLDRDHLRFGRYFFLAAMACGLAIAIKLLGFFFFFTILLYLAAGIIQNQITIPRSLVMGTLFVIIMAATVVFTNPFLFSDEQRARMVDIQDQKREELDKGYQHDNAIYYSKGPRWWVSTLEKWYGSPFFLLFFFVSLAAGCIRGPRTFLNRLILTWVVPYSIYLLYFVAVKPDHYWLPVMLPLFSAAFALFDIFPIPLEKGKSVLAAKISLRWLAPAAVIAIIAVQLILNLSHSTSGNIPIYQSAIATGITQIRTIR